MKLQIGIAILCLVPFAVSTCLSSSAQNCKVEHEGWLAEILRQIEMIQPGMSRKDLLTIFTSPPGLFVETRLSGTYAYKGSLYIRVDVQFTPATGTEGSGAEDPRDVIKTISKPYLVLPVYD